MRLRARFPHRALRSLADSLPPASPGSYVAALRVSGLASERNARLRECGEVIRALWAGKTVTHLGRIHVEEATLWSRPAHPPPIVGPALSEEMAEFVGRWADALITVQAPRERLRALIEAFRRGGSEGKPLYLQVHLSFAATDDEARANAFDQWRTGAFPGIVSEELHTTRQFDAIARSVRPEDLDGFVRISSDPERHVAWLHDDLDLGFERVYLHNVGRNQREFIEAYGERVLPRLAAPEGQIR